MLKRLALMLYGVCLSSIVLSQEMTDWRSWTSIGINYGINDRLSLRSKVEYRTKYDFQESDRWHINAGLKYKLLPFLEIKGAYEIHYRKQNSDIWRIRHRYNMGAQAVWKKGNLILAWRERFQQTIQDGQAESILRSRVKMDYKIKGTILQPYFSVESFQLLDNGTFPDVFRIRYMPGMRFSFSEKYYLLAFYCRQQEESRYNNILGLEMNMNF